MTERKEIIEMLKVLKEQALKSHNDTAIIDVKKDSFIYVMDATINSLKMEQIEPCEDAVSRQAVLDATVKRNSIWNKITNSKGENLEEIILQLPSVNPQEPKINILDKIRAEIAEFGSIWVVYKITGIKDKDIERLVNDVLKQAKEQVLDVIDKYKAESEDKE